MARPLRIEYSGAIYHITVRGNARQRIFRDDRDRRALLKRLSLSVKSYGIRVFLYCLMDNHFHLVLETPRANLGRFMQSVLTGYTVSYNIRHRRCGHLVQGRYGARLVAGDDYLLKLSRYVHLNPVKVKAWRSRPLPERMARLKEYPWSSYRAYIGLVDREEWVDYEPMLGLTSVDPKISFQCYEHFVEKGVADTDDEFLQELELSPRSIGDETYRHWVNERHEIMQSDRRLEEDVMFRKERAFVDAQRILKIVAKAWDVPVEDLLVRRRNWSGKAMAAFMLEKYGGLSRRACAPLIGISSGVGVAYQIRKMAELAKADPTMAARLSKVEAQLEKEPSK